MSYILVVEDETDLREVFVEAIRDEGFQVIESVTADLAMEWLASEDVRLIVTDINLPGRLNGIELALAARERHPDIPLIFVSGKPGMLERARELCGAASYLGKPFRLETLLDHVRRCMKGQVPIQISNKSTSDNEDRLLVQSITDCAIFKIDPQGFIASWNPGAERIKGYTADEVIGTHFSKFFTAEDQARGWPEQSLRAAREAGRSEDEGWRVRKDGTRFRASVVIHAIRAGSGVLKGFAKVTRDISEKHAARQALEASEGRLRLLLDNVVHRAIYSLDLEGHITSWNPGAELAKGYTKDEILCRHFSIFYTPEDQAKGKPATALRMARETGRFEEEGWRVRKDGTCFWASVVLDPMRDAVGQLVGFAKVTHDISDKRLVQEAREQLHRAQKMETIGQLTAGVAHDFNNLLAAVMGSLELIAAHPGDQRSVDRLVKAAMRAINRGSKLTQQLLSFSRLQLLSPEVSNINDLITGFQEMLRRTTGTVIEIRIKLGAQLWLTHIDQAHFQSALLNVVANACDAMPHGGVLTIETLNLDVDAAEAALLTEIDPGPYVVVMVCDTGHGMTPEVQARATEPFYTTKDVGRSGLGLSQTYGFVRQSNGQMEIQTSPGVGTSISLYLPRLDHKLPCGVQPNQPAEQLRGGTILVVDDDPDVLEVAAAAIESFGYTVHAAADGQSALEVLKRDIPIDLLFTDVVMPLGLSGVALAREACQLRPELRVLLASGYPRTIIEQSEGVDDSMELIAKPYALSTLSQRLRTLALGQPN